MKGYLDVYLTYQLKPHLTLYLKRQLRLQEVRGRENFKNKVTPRELKLPRGPAPIQDVYCHVRF